MLPRWLAHAQSIVPIARVPPSHILPSGQPIPPQSHNVGLTIPISQMKPGGGVYPVSSESWRRDCSCEATGGIGGGGVHLACLSCLKEAGKPGWQLHSKALLHGSRGLQKGGFPAVW